MYTSEHFLCLLTIARWHATKYAYDFQIDWNQKMMISHFFGCYCKLYFLSWTVLFPRAGQIVCKKDNSIGSSINALWSSLLESLPKSVLCDGGSNSFSFCDSSSSCQSLSSLILGTSSQCICGTCYAVVEPVSLNLTLTCIFVQAAVHVCPTRLHLQLLLHIPVTFSVTQWHSQKEGFWAPPTPPINYSVHTNLPYTVDAIIITCLPLYT